MSSHPHPVSRFPRLRKLWKPALAIWFEEIIAIAVEFISVIVISLMTGLIYLFKTYVFKSAMPKAEDVKNK